MAGMRRRAIWLGAVLGLWACGDDAGADGTDSGSSSTTTGVTSTSDGSTSGGSTNADTSSGGAGTETTDGESSGDDATTTGAMASCTAPTLEETFELDPNGPNGQIHPAVFYDASLDAVWVTYNVPSEDGSGQFDVFATRVGCDGQAQLDPVRVNQTLGDNDIDPELVRTDAGLLVVWSSDDGTGGGSNLDIRMQLLDDDGFAQWSADHVLETTFEGAPFTASAWMPRISAGAGGDVAVVGTRGIEAASAFQVFVQRVAGDGSSLGSTVAWAPMPGIAHDTPHLAVDADGDAWTAWVRTEDFVLRQVETGRVVGDAFAAATPTLLQNTDSTGPSVVSTSDGVFVAVSEALGAGRRVSVVGLEPAVAEVMLGETGLHHTPALAPVPGGVAVAAYRNLGGLDNELWVARVNNDATATVPVAIPGAVAAPYATTITHVGDGVVFVAWAQGDSPNFRVFGRLVSAR